MDASPAEAHTRTVGTVAEPCPEGRSARAAGELREGMMPRGDTIRVGGMEYLVVWSGAKDDPSLLDDYPRGSTLGPFGEQRPEPGRRLRGSAKNGTTRQIRQARTMAK